MKKTNLVTLLFCLIVLPAFTQQSGIENYIRLLQTTGSGQVIAAQKVEQEMGTADTTQILKQLEQLKSKAGSGKRMQARLLALEARLLFYKLGPGDSLYTANMKTALDLAYELDDYYMVAEFSRWYGEMLNSMRNRPLAAQYCMNALKIQEELGYVHFPEVKQFTLTVAEMLYRTENNREAVNYYLQALRIPGDVRDSVYFAGSLNTLGKAYMHIKKYDSSLFYLEQCMAFCRKKNIPDDWYYAASDNRFDAFLQLNQLDSCRSIASNLLQAGLPSDSGILQAASYLFCRIEMKEKKFAEAVKWGLQSVTYGGPDAGMSLLLAYKNIAQAYEEMGQMENAHVYFKKFKELDEENNRLKQKASAAFLEAQANFEKSQARIKSTKQEREQAIRLRNIVIAVIALGAIAALFYLNRKRKRTEQARKEAEQKSVFFEKKFNTAVEQLNAFRKDILDKDEMISRLQTSQENKTATQTEIETIHNLSRQIILTENDWQQFKETFDSVYPLFFTKLKTAYPGITNAELRMAALIKLNFDSRQSASMLGISQESVHKTRYRLRKRFNGDIKTSLEEWIMDI